jgi:hypothetical protein
LGICRRVYGSPASAAGGRRSALGVRRLERIAGAATLEERPLTAPLLAAIAARAVLRASNWPPLKGALLTAAAAATETVTVTVTVTITALLPHVRDARSTAEVHACPAALFAVALEWSTALS